MEQTVGLLHCHASHCSSAWACSFMMGQYICPSLQRSIALSLFDACGDDPLPLIICCVPVLMSPNFSVSGRVHMAHTMLLMIAICGARDLFEDLRASFNRMRLASALPIPPFEEWRGLSSICDHVYCRYLAPNIEMVVKCSSIRNRKPSALSILLPTLMSYAYTALSVQLFSQSYRPCSSTLGRITGGGSAQRYVPQSFRLVQADSIRISARRWYNMLSVLRSFRRFRGDGPPIAFLVFCARQYFVLPAKAPLSGLCILNLSAVR